MSKLIYVLALLAAEARREVGRSPATPLSTVAICLNTSSPGEVPVRIVIEFEVIDIADDETEGMAVANRALPFDRCILIEATAIVEARQPIHVHHPLQLKVRFEELLLTYTQRTVSLISLQLVQRRASSIAVETWTVGGEKSDSITLPTAPCRWLQR